jgi:hypothetical protein
MGVQPRRGQELVAQALKRDQVLAHPDAAVRAAYENRATGLDAGDRQHGAS